MSTYFKIVWLISSITVLISSTDISAQESDREQAADLTTVGVMHRRCFMIHIRINISEGR